MLSVEQVRQRRSAGESWSRLAGELGVPVTTLRGAVRRGRMPGLLTGRTASTTAPEASKLSTGRRAGSTPAGAVALKLPAFRRMEGDTSALVHKYRPRVLEELLGQPAVAASLKGFVAAPHSGAFLFSGESGTGKSSAAYALAQELAVSAEDHELGGLFEIPSGCQHTEKVKDLLALLRFRPLMGSGWRVVIVNECDRMPLPVESIWLDALEHLPPQTVVIFTTNDTSRLSRRFRDRCEEHVFDASVERLGPWLRAFCQMVWQREGGAGPCPELDRLGLPSLDAGGEAHFAPSFRLALQQLQRLLRARLAANGGSA